MIDDRIISANLNLSLSLSLSLLLRPLIDQRRIRRLKFVERLFGIILVGLSACLLDCLFPNLFFETRIPFGGPFRVVIGLVCCLTALIPADVDASITVSDGNWFVDTSEPQTPGVFAYILAFGDIEFSLGVV